MCRSRRLLILSIAALGTTLASAFALQLQPKFTATAAVMIAPRPGHSVGPNAVPDGPGEPATVATQIKLIKSREHAERVGRALELYKDPELGPGDRRKRDLAFRIADPWRMLVQWLPGDWLMATGLAEERPDRLEADPRGDLEHAIDAFASRLAVVRVGGSHVINISFTAADPAKAASLANKTAELYVAGQPAAKRQASTGAAVRSPAGIAAPRGRPDSERAGTPSRGQPDLAAADRLALNEQERAGLQRELIVAEAELAGRRARLDLIDSLRARGEGLHALPEVMASPHVADLWRQETELRKVEAELRSVYGDNHPQVRSVLADQAKLADKIETAVERIVASLDSETRMIEGRIGALLARLEFAGGANPQSGMAAVPEPERLADADRLTRLLRYEGTDGPAEIREPEARIIARAAPPSAPSSPGVPIFAAFGFVGSSLVGVLVALVAHRLDRRVRDAGQLQAQLGLRCLAICPRLPRSFASRDKAAHDYLIERPRSHYAESMRSLQLALRGTPDAGLPKVIQITSAVSDEGKTTLAFSLATALVQGGARVLLFELDLRRPSILKRSWSRGAGVAASTPLFSELHHDPHTGLDLILVVKPARRPEDILRSQDLAAIMQRLRRRYDHIVVDSGPLLGPGDGKLLRELVDAVVLAVRWQSTSLDLVRDARDQLGRGTAPSLGAVITQADLDRLALRGCDFSYHRQCRRYCID